MTGQELTVIDRQTGEIVALKDATMEALAAYMTELRAVREQQAEVESQISDELCKRLDQSACWTQHVRGSDGEVWEIKAPSPTAGTDAYPPERLEPELQALVEDGIINEGAATGALRRTVSLEIGLPWSADPQVVADALRNAVRVEIAGFEVQVLAAAPVRKTVASGIAKLRKIAGTQEALDRALIKMDAPKRRVKVTVK